jgi:streptomycin 6-kinase
LRGTWNIMQLPDLFKDNIRGAFGLAGEIFLEDLPARVAEATQRWSLTGVEPVDNLSYNFVAFAKRGAQDVILKIGVPNSELTSEIETLRVYDGRGACRLLESEAERGMLLIERIRPGRMLAALEDDEHATVIAAEGMARLWRPAPHEGKILSLRKWFEAVARMRVRFDGGTGPLSEPFVAKAEGLIRELFADGQPDVLLHGDFHHYNVLESERGWLAIDPKGVAGPAGYEVGPLLINPFDLLKRTDPLQITERRIAILAERLGFERASVQSWGIAHAVLSACWSLEGDPGDSYRHAIRCGEIIAAVRT